LYQFQQIPRGKQRAALGNHNIRIGRIQAGPACRNPIVAVLLVLKEQPVFPVNASAEQNTKLLAKQGMKRMGDAENVVIASTIPCI
jgi:hypothetical protein